MNILLMTQHYPPEKNFITGDLAHHWKSQGHTVRVITAIPNYPLGKYFPGYSARWPFFPSRENNGVNVWRLPIYTDHTLGKIRRIVCYLSFAIEAFVLALWVGRKSDQVWVYQTPFSSALSALPLKYLFGAKLVLINADLWPESFPAAGIRLPRFVYKILYAYSAWINRRADAIVSTTQGMHMRYLKDGIAARKITMIPLWVEGSWSKPIVPQKASSEIFQQTGFIYAGNLGPAQDIQHVVRACKILQDEGISFRFTIYGTGSQKEFLQELVRDLSLGSAVHFGGYVDPSTLIQKISSSMAQIMHLKKSDLFEMVIPSKLGFSLAQSAPLICAASGESARIATEARAIVCEPCSPQSIANGMKKVLLMSDEDRNETIAQQRKYFDSHLHPATLLKSYDLISHSLSTPHDSAQHSIPT